MKLLFTLLFIAVAQSNADCRDRSTYCNYVRRSCYLTGIKKACPVTCGACIPQCGKSSYQGGRVIGGTTPRKGQWPWQVVLVYGRKAFCGGTLIAPDWVLTAAHCTRNKNVKYVRIGAGDFSLYKRDGTEQFISAQSLHTHAGFSFSHMSNDIALIKLQKPFMLNQYVGTACLPKQKIPAGSTCYITGWGKVTHPGKMSAILQQAQMKIVDGQRCAKLNNKSMRTTLIPTTMLCAGSGGSNKISGCHGDSGGPLVCNVNGRWEVSGATSHGDSRCRSNYTYTVFANVHHYRPWITRIMNSY